MQIISKINSLFKASAEAVSSSDSGMISKAIHWTVYVLLLFVVVTALVALSIDSVQFWSEAAKDIPGILEQYLPAEAVAIDATECAPGADCSDVPTK